jgi:phosphoglycerate kinase
MRIKSIRDFTLRGKKLFLRLDFNVPLSGADEHGNRHVLDDTRIREAVPTIQYAREQGAKIIIASHLGRPNGKVNEDFSMMPAAMKLAELLDTEITLVDDCYGEGIELKAAQLQNGEVMMLENLRFHKEEEENDLEFAQQLAKLADIYVTDAFGTAHRKHASTHRLPSIVPDRGMGFLIQKELKFFDTMLNNPAQPFYLILGGAKVSDKINTIHSLMKRVQGVGVGQPLRGQAGAGRRLAAGVRV